MIQKQGTSIASPSGYGLDDDGAELWYIAKLKNPAWIVPCITAVENLKSMRQELLYFCPALNNATAIKRWNEVTPDDPASVQSDTGDVVTLKVGNQSIGVRIIPPIQPGK